MSEQENKDQTTETFHRNDLDGEDTNDDDEGADNSTAEKQPVSNNGQKSNNNNQEPETALSASSQDSHAEQPPPSEINPTGDGIKETHSVTLAEQTKGLENNGNRESVDSRKPAAHNDHSLEGEGDVGDTPLSSTTQNFDASEEETAHTSAMEVQSCQQSTTNTDDSAEINEPHEAETTENEKGQCPKESDNGTNDGSIPANKNARDEGGKDTTDSVSQPSCRTEDLSAQGSNVSNKKPSVIDHPLRPEERDDEMDRDEETPTTGQRQDKMAADDRQTCPEEERGNFLNQLQKAYLELDKLKLKNEELKKTSMDFAEKDIENQRIMCERKEEIHRYKKEIDDLKGNLAATNDAKTNTDKKYDEEKKKWKNEVEVVKRKLENRYDEEKKKWKNEVEALKVEKRKVENSHNEMSAKHRDAERKLKDTEATMQCLNQSFIKREKELMDYIHYVESQQKEAARRIETLENQLVQAVSTTEFFREQLHDSTKSNAELKEQNQSLLLRLSKIAGAKLKSNNPNIADLNDPNRPTKLAEMFSELYDNEWTDAFEALDNKPDEDRIAMLLQILERVHQMCEDVTETHVKSIQESLTTLKVCTKVSDSKSKLAGNEQNKESSNEDAEMIGGEKELQGAEPEGNSKVPSCTQNEEEQSREQKEEQNVEHESDIKYPQSECTEESVRQTEIKMDVNNVKEQEVSNTQHVSDEDHSPQKGTDKRENENVSNELGKNSKNTNDAEKKQEESTDITGNNGTNANNDTNKYGLFESSNNRSLEVSQDNTEVVGQNFENLETQRSMNDDFSPDSRSIISRQHTSPECGANSGDETQEQENTNQVEQGGDHSKPDKTEQSAGDLSEERSSGSNTDKTDHHNRKETGNGSGDEDSLQESKTNGAEDDSNSEKEDTRNRFNNILNTNEKATGNEEYGAKEGNDAAESADTPCVEKVVVYPYEELSDTQKSTVLEIRKQVLVGLQKQMHEMMTEVICEEMKLADEVVVLKYAKRCIELSWAMCEHSPPVYMLFEKEIKDDTPFKSDVYKPYTRLGKDLEYVVWPPLYLHQGGPMLSKGVAQGINKS